MKNNIKDIFRQFEITCKQLGKAENRLISFDTLDENIAINKIKDELESVTRKWNIDQEWVIENIFQSFMCWYENEETKYDLFIYDPAIGKVNNIINYITKVSKITAPTYNPLILTEKDYDKAVKEYKEEVKKVIEESGYNSAELRRTLEQFKWFVCYHVLEHSVVEIAESYYISEDSVKKEIKKIYDTIGLAREKRK